MIFYRVKVNGTNLLVEFDDGRIARGFIKNEYLWALNEQEAGEKAVERVKIKVSEKPGVRIPSESSPEIKAELVEPCFNPLKVLGEEGFIFYEDDDHPPSLSAQLH